VTAAVSAQPTATVPTVRDVAWQGKTALVRVDFNVPMHHGQIADDTRIRAVLPTLDYLRTHGARILLLSHLGRPDGKPDPKYSLAPIAQRLGTLLSSPVVFGPDCVGPQAEAAASGLAPSGVALFENVRFHPEEEANDPAFAARLAVLGDFYVNDAFATAHRAHASTEGIAHCLPSVAGLLIEKEILTLGTLLHQPKRPFVAVIGGAKVSSKLGVLRNLMDRVDQLLVGGGIANTFLKASGCEVGKSLLEVDLVPTATGLLTQRGKIRLPIDVVVTTSLEDGSSARTAMVEDVLPEELIVDIGPRTMAAYADEINHAGTVFWNGPMGVFEQPRFSAGTVAMAHAMADSSATTVVGGGESVEAVNQTGVADRLTLVSTGGGAALEFLEGKTLPGVAALQQPALLTPPR
jgi:phosphoglycerate kinase